MLMADVTGRGGAEKALVDLAVRLDRGRFNVSVCATRYAGNYQPLLDAGGVRTFIWAGGRAWICTNLRAWCLCFGDRECISSTPTLWIQHLGGGCWEG